MTLMSLVSLVKFNEKEMSLQEAVEEALRLIDFQSSPGVKKIAIKPNMCYYWDYSTGETTDPKFVAAIIDTVRKRISPTINISVVESDASAMKCKYAFRMLGYEKMAEEKKVALVNLSDDDAEDTNVKVGDSTFEFSLPKTLAEADMLINVPKIRYMQQVKISCALKNIYGCNPYPKKFKYHKHLDEVIIALNKITKPHLTILDGIIASGIGTRKLGLVMASTDAVAIDAAAARIAGMNPHSLKYLQLASREKIGSLDFVPKGEALDHFKRLFPRKTTTYKTRELLSRLYFHFAPNH